MGNFTVSKATVTVIICLILAVIMVLCPFFWGSTAMEEMEEMELNGLLLWVYYICFALTLVFSVIGNSDFAKLFSKVTFGVFVLTIAAVLIDYADGNFMERIGIGMYGQLAASLISMISVHKGAKEAAK